jgi:hypothetical protein
MGTTNRVARVADLTRAIVADLKAGSREPIGECAAEIDRLKVRSRLLIRALRAVYASLAAFATTALLAIAGAVGSYFGTTLAYEIVGVAAALTGTIAVACLVAGCSYIVMETRLALRSLEYEAQNALGRAGG